MLYLWKTQLQLINVSGCCFRVTYFPSRFLFWHTQIKGCMEGEIYWFALTVPPSLSSHFTELELANHSSFHCGKSLTFPAFCYCFFSYSGLNWTQHFPETKPGSLGNFIPWWQEFISSWLFNCHCVTSVSLRSLCWGRPKTQQFGETTDWSERTAGR